MTIAQIIGIFPKETRCHINGDYQNKLENARSQRDLTAYDSLDSIYRAVLPRENSSDGTPGQSFSFQSK